MATLAEYRKKFPQYADLSDEQLANGLYQKFYSDMDPNEFKQKIGLSTNQYANTKISETRTALDSALQGLTFGYGDELAAGLNSAGDYLEKATGGLITNGGENKGKSYDDTVKKYRDFTDASEAQNPNTATVAGLAGAVAPYLVAGPEATIGKMLGYGAADAVVRGTGDREGSDKLDLGDMLLDAGTGAAMGGAGYGLGKAAGALSKPFRKVDVGKFSKNPDPFDEETFQKMKEAFDSYEANPGFKPILDKGTVGKMAFGATKEAVKNINKFSKSPLATTLKVVGEGISPAVKPIYEYVMNTLKGKAFKDLSSNDKKVLDFVTKALGEDALYKPREGDALDQLLGDQKKRSLLDRLLGRNQDDAYTTVEASDLLGAIKKDKDTNVNKIIGSMKTAMTKNQRTQRIGEMLTNTADAIDPLGNFKNNPFSKGTAMQLLGGYLTGGHSLYTSYGASKVLKAIGQKLAKDTNSTPKRIEGILQELQKSGFIDEVPYKYGKVGGLFDTLAKNPFAAPISASDIARKKAREKKDKE
jgi:hypothetical protein